MSLFGFSTATGISSGTLAARPAAGTADRYYWATDIVMLFRDTGAAWEVVSTQPYQRYLNGVVPFHEMIDIGIAQIANRVCYTPFHIPFTCTLSGIVITTKGLVGAANAYSALYSAVNEAPANRLAVSNSTVITGLTDQKVHLPFTAGIQVTPGYYFGAFEQDTAEEKLHATINSRHCVPSNINNGPVCYIEDLGGFIAPPAAATPAFPGYAAWLTTGMLLRVTSMP